MELSNLVPVNASAYMILIYEVHDCCFSFLPMFGNLSINATIINVIFYVTMALRFVIM